MTTPQIPAIVAIAMVLIAASCTAPDDELEVSHVEQGLTSGLLDQGFGFGGQATGGAAADRVYVVTSTSDDGSCGTLRYGVEQMPGATWIVFDPNVFPANTKKAIQLSRSLRVPNDTTIDGRGSWVSLRRTYDASDIFWQRNSNGTFECKPTPGNPVKDPILEIRATNVIVTNLDFLQTFPLGTVAFVNTSGGGGGTVDLDAESFTNIDAECFGDAISIGYHSSEVWIDHSDFTHCGDGCIDVRNYEPTGMTEVTISNNKLTTSNKGMTIGVHEDATANGTILIAASVYQNRFVSVNIRQPRIEAAAALVYNNVFEDWRLYGVQVEAHNEDNDPILVNSRGLVEHNVFRAVTTSDNPWRVREKHGWIDTTDPRLWVRENKCSGTTCNNSDFPECGTAWYYPCTQEMRGNLIDISSMTYAEARDLLRPLGGSSRTVTNDVRGHFLPYACPPPNAPP